MEYQLSLKIAQKLSVIAVNYHKLPILAPLTYKAPIDRPIYLLLKNYILDFLRRVEA